MLNALEYALGIYTLSLVITMIVWLLIVTIRWVSSERPKAKAVAAKL
jgi:hypothetical protein